MSPPLNIINDNSRPEFIETTESNRQSHSIKSTFTRPLKFDDSYIYHKNDAFSSYGSFSFSNKTKNATIDEKKLNKFKKSLLPFENQGTTITNHFLNRNVQRCAVSRRVSIEKDVNDCQTILSSPIMRSVKSIADCRTSLMKTENIDHKTYSIANKSSFSRPLRALHMSPTDTKTYSFLSSQFTKKSPLNSSNHDVQMDKTLSGRTIFDSALPSSVLINTRKEN